MSEVQDERAYINYYFGSYWSWTLRGPRFGAEQGELRNSCTLVTRKSFIFFILMEVGDGSGKQRSLTPRSGS
jgi:hypothetical protein